MKNSVKNSLKNGTRFLFFFSFFYADESLNVEERVWEKWKLVSFVGVEYISVTLIVALGTQANEDNAIVFGVSHRAPLIKQGKHRDGLQAKASVSSVKPAIDRCAVRVCEYVCLRALRAHACPCVCE